MMLKKKLLFAFSLLLLLTLSNCNDLNLVINAVRNELGPEDVPHNDEEVFVWQDDFSQPESGWDRFELDFGYADYVDGTMQLHVSEPEHFLWSNAGVDSPSNVRVRVNATKIDGENDDFYGVVCRYQNEYNYYALLISGDGYAGIFKRENGGDLVSVTGDTMMPREAIGQDLNENILQADCVGSHLALWVNGFLVDVVKDETFSPSVANPGDVGLIVGTFEATSTTVQFSDFKLFELK